MTGSKAAAVATIIEPGVRASIDAVAQGRFSAFHADSVREVLRTVRERPVQAVFVSPECVAVNELSAIATLVDRFPEVSTVALVSRHDPVCSERLLEFGAYGVRRMVDLSQRTGWEHLRELLEQPTSATAARISGAVLPALGQPTHDCRKVFEVMVRVAPGIRTVKALTDYLEIAPSTFMSRFVRADLPSPRQYLAATRLAYAAALFEMPGISIADVAYRLEFSSPQSFCRHLRTLIGTTASEFKRRSSFEATLRDFVERLIVPFRNTFRTFHPLENGVGYLGH
ncbi:MAG: helix-turn-helix domain-containing protein [Gemmatimonadales bacterium]